MIYPIEIIKENINKEYLKKFLDNPFKEVVKFVADIDREIIAFGGELHSDAQEVLVDNGSDGRNFWGGNIFLPENGGGAVVEYSALMNIKPSQNNFSMDIKDEKLIERVKEILKKIIIDL